MFFFKPIKKSKNLILYFKSREKKANLQIIIDNATFNNKKNKNINKI